VTSAAAVTIPERPEDAAAVFGLGLLVVFIAFIAGLVGPLPVRKK